MFAEWCQCVSTVSRQLELYSQKGHIFTECSRFINETFCAQVSSMKIQPFHFEEEDIFCIEGPNYLALWMQVIKGPSKVYSRMWVPLSKGMGRRSEHRLEGTCQGSGAAHCPHRGGSGHRSPHLCLRCPWHLFREMCKKQGMYEVICPQIYCWPLTVSTATPSHNPLHKTIGKDGFFGCYQTF